MNFLIDKTAAKNDQSTQFENLYLHLFQTLMEYEINVSDSEEKVINLLSYTMLFIPMILGLIPTLVLTEFFIKDANKLVSILLNVSQDAKDQAKKKK